MASRYIIERISGGSRCNLPRLSATVLTLYSSSSDDDDDDDEEDEDEDVVPCSYSIFWLQNPELSEKEV
jgi:hypothetical protein